MAYFDLNSVSIRGLERPELEHARWLYRREWRQLRLLHTWLWVSNRAVGLAVLVSAIAVGWVGIQATVRATATAAGVPLALVSPPWLLVVAGATLPFFGYLWLLKRTPLEAWMESRSAAEEEARAYAQMCESTLRQIKQLLADDGKPRPPSHSDRTD